jgi:glutathione S-transferase
LPADAEARAWVRGIALINAADSQPLIVLRVRHYLSDVLKVSDEQRPAWIHHWLGAGMQAVERVLAEQPSSGVFCHGDRPTIVDICLVTQAAPAKTSTSPSSLSACHAQL